MTRQQLLGRGERLAALDGLRGLAILLVMILHFSQDGILNPQALPDRWFAAVASYGWCGVTLFFVLSGFLITRILCDTRERPGYFLDFHMNRASRILPVYFGFLALWLWLGPLLYPWPEDFMSAPSWWWWWTFTGNLLQAWRGDLDAAAPFTAHFWSLAVEAQFYLAWPVVVLACTRRSLVFTCVACIVASVLLRTVFVLSGNLVAPYVMMPARMDALAAGALVAVWGRESDSWSWLRTWAPSVVAVSFALFVAIAAAPSSPDFVADLVTIVGHTALAVGFGALLVLTIDPDPGRRTATALGHCALRFFGRYSYTLYVVHPLVAFWVARTLFDAKGLPAIGGSQLPGQLVFMAVAGGASVVCSLLIWHLYEKHFLHLRGRFRRSEKGPCVEPNPRDGGTSAAQVR